MDKFILLVGLLFLMFGCGDEATGPYPYTQVPVPDEGKAPDPQDSDANPGETPHPPVQPNPEEPEEPNMDGANLYKIKCSGCHGNLANSSKHRKTKSEIISAIGRIKAMKNLIASEEEIAKIAQALKR